MTARRTGITQCIRGDKSPFPLAHPYCAFEEKMWMVETYSDEKFTALARPEAKSYYGKLLGKDKKNILALIEKHKINAGLVGACLNLRGFEKWFEDARSLLHDDEDPDIDLSGLNSATVDIERLRFVMASGRIFETSESLEESLNNTDIGEDAPCGFFRLPYPHIYIRFGEGKRGVLLEFPEEESLDTTYGYIDGGYCREYLAEDGNREVIIGLTLRMPTTKVKYPIPLGSITIHLDERKTVREVLDYMFNHGEWAGVSQWQKHAANQVVQHIAKILLYTNTAEARMRNDFTKTELLERAKITTGKKLKKIKNRINKAYDRIIVGPEEETLPLKAAVELGKKTTHWRRGHFKKVRFGEGRKNTRIKWISPVLVNSDGLAGAAKLKKYSIR